MTFEEDLKNSLIEELNNIEDAEGNTLDRDNIKTIEKLRNYIINFEEMGD